jgi:hypothetical protein
VHEERKENPSGEHIQVQALGNKQEQTESSQGYGLYIKNLDCTGLTRIVLLQLQNVISYL